MKTQNSVDPISASYCLQSREGTAILCHGAAHAPGPGSGDVGGDLVGGVAAGPTAVSHQQDMPEGQCQRAQGAIAPGLIPNFRT